MPARTRGIVDARRRRRRIGLAAAAAGGRDDEQRRDERKRDDEAAQGRQRTVAGRLRLARRGGRFEGKRGLVLGVANKRSIAWAIARRLADERRAARVHLPGRADREERPRARRDRSTSPLVTACDVRSDEDVARVFGEVGEAFGGQLDLLVHSVAFAAAEDLEGRFTDTPRDRFWMALDVSAYSLVACARAAEPLMEARRRRLDRDDDLPRRRARGAALQRDGRRQGDARRVGASYLAWDLGQKNIRVNAVSAGPVRTLAARSIAGFPTMEAIVEERSPLHRHDRRRRRRRRRRLPALGRREERHRRRRSTSTPGTTRWACRAAERALRRP